MMDNGNCAGGMPDAAAANRAHLQTIGDLQQQRDVLINERDKMRRQRDHYRDVLKGISTNINNMLRPIGGMNDD